MQQNAFRAAVTLSMLLLAPQAFAQDAVDPAHAMTPAAPAVAPSEAVSPAAAAPEAAPAPQATPAAPQDGAPAPAPPPDAPPSYAPAPYYPQPAPSDAPSTGPEEILYGPGPIAVGKPTPIGTPGAREHDGLFLRISVGAGAGFTRYRESVDGQNIQTVKTAGVAGQFELALGGRVAGNLILHGNLLLSGMDDARKTVSGVRDASNVISTSFAMLGAGATYYFMPFNVYVTGAGGLAAMNETRDEQLSLETGAGFAGSLTLGKEWWVGRGSEWGVGAALRGTSMWAPVQIAGVESTMRGSQITIAFSATLN